MASRTLTNDETGLLKIALATLMQKGKETSGRVDRATDDPDLYDPLHAGIASERSTAQDLMELIETAEQIEFHLPD